MSHFTLNSAERGLDVAEPLGLELLKEHPSAERSTKCTRELHTCLAPGDGMGTDLSAHSEPSKITGALQKGQTRSQDYAEEKFRAWGYLVTKKTVFNTH